jgi:hypothetical protein
MDNDFLKKGLMFDMIFLFFCSFIIQKNYNYDNVNNLLNCVFTHILCPIEIKIHHVSIDVHKFINSSKYSYISIHDGHGLMMMYDIHMHLDSFNTIINDGLEYITSTFNINT